MQIEAFIVTFAAKWMRSFGARQDHLYTLGHLRSLALPLGPLEKPIFTPWATREAYLDPLGPLEKLIFAFWAT